MSALEVVKRSPKTVYLDEISEGKLTRDTFFLL
jgi:hypothetical protein